MSSPAVHHARLSNHAAAVAAALARIGLDASWWRHESRCQRALSRQFATADHVDRLLRRAEKEAA